MLDKQTIVTFPETGRARVRGHRTAVGVRTAVGPYRAKVQPIFGARPLVRERSHAGLGLVIAFGFSIACWAGMAAIIF